ncbi:MAG: DUF1295 domain-containing protein [archaeon GB-1845-036]|nr:DUF1295 domain-containing protein [Candidatus Culexmicrobium thermophilum]
MKVEKNINWIIPLAVFSTYLLINWILNFGLQGPTQFWMLTLNPNGIFLSICLFLMSMVAAILALMKRSMIGSLTVVGWWLYMPVIWNIMVPMFISFLTVIGICYTSWLPITSTYIGNLMLNGFIMIRNEAAARNINLIANLLLIAGITIYIYSLYQLIYSKIVGKELLMSGIYSMVRHPQYLGIILWTLGAAIIGRRPINFIAWITLAYIYFLLAEEEERKLELKFKEKYLTYAKYTNFIFPLPVKITFGSRKIRILIYTLIYILAVSLMLMYLPKYTVMLKSL